MNPVLLMLITTVLGNPALQDAVAQPLADVLANALPDVTEDVLGDFLMKVGAKLKAANQ